MKKRQNDRDIYKKYSEHFTKDLTQKLESLDTHRAIQRYSSTTRRTKMIFCLFTYNHRAYDRNSRIKHRALTYVMKKFTRHKHPLTPRLKFTSYHGYDRHDLVLYFDWSDYDFFKRTPMSVSRSIDYLDLTYGYIEEI